MSVPVSSTSRRRSRWLRVAGLVFALALIATALTAVPSRGSASGGPTPVLGAPGVFRFGASLAGHDNITLDESGLSPESGRLTFAQLEQWRYVPENPAPAPEALQRLDRRELALSGFMFPLEAGKELRSFCLLKTTQTCCYGPMPQFNQYVLVEMDTPVRLVAGRPVTVTGRFHLDPQPGEGFIYRMDGRAFADASPDLPKIVTQ